jgi:hypothetical protein
MSAVLSINEAGMFVQPISKAVSEEAGRINRCFIAAQNAYLRNSASFAAHYQDMKSEFDSVMSEAQVPNWDGHGAQPVSWAAIHVAESFIKALPTTLPSPEFSVDPDGEISLDWIRGRNQIMSISIRGDGVLSYAARFGVAKQNGSEIFIGELPAIILNCLRRLHSL